MTERSDTEGTWLLWVIAIAVVASMLGAALHSQYDDQVQRSCMDSVVTPDPEAIDYDQQALDFQAEIRKCLRG